MVIPTDNNMAYIYYFIRTQPCLQVHSEIHNYSNTRITQIPKPSNPSTHVPFFYCIRPIPLYVPSGLWHVGMSHQKNICQIGYSNPVLYTDTRIRVHVALVKPCTDYSLHPLLIAIFQNFKCSKIIDIFAIGMGCGNK